MFNFRGEIFALFSPYPYTHVLYIYIYTYRLLSLCNFFFFCIFFYLRRVVRPANVTQLNIPFRERLGRRPTPVYYIKVCYLFFRRGIFFFFNFYSFFFSFRRFILTKYNIFNIIFTFFNDYILLL